MLRIRDLSRGFIRARFDSPAPIGFGGLMID